MPQDLQYIWRLTQILTESTIELGKCALVVETSAQSKVLQSMMDIFAAQVSSMESDCPTDLCERLSPTRNTLVWIDLLDRQILSSICTITDPRLPFLHPTAH